MTEKMPKVYDNKIKLQELKTKEYLQRENQIREAKKFADDFNKLIHAPGYPAMKKYIQCLIDVKILERNTLVNSITNFDEYGKKSFKLDIEINILKMLLNEPERIVEASKDIK